MPRAYRHAIGLRQNDPFYTLLQRAILPRLGRSKCARSVIKSGLVGR